MQGRHTHTFYFREKWQEQTHPQHERVQNMLQFVLRDTAPGDTFEDTVVEKFMNRLGKIQTSYKRQQGSRLTAVVYRWRSELCAYSNRRTTFMEFSFSTFGQRYSGESYEKRALRRTAIQRLRKAPHSMCIQRWEQPEIPRFERNEMLQKMITQLRKSEGLRHLKT